MISTGADPIIAVAIEKALAQGNIQMAASYEAVFSAPSMAANVAMTPGTKLVTAAIQQANRTIAELSINNVVDTRQSDNYRAIRSMVNDQNKKGQ